MSQTIYLDFDKTLFDVSRYITQLVFPELAGVANRSLEEIRTWGASYRQSLANPTLFSPSQFCTFIADQVGEPSLETELEAVFHRDDLIQQALFPEVKAVVLALSAHHTLRIFSQGTEKWQREKIEKSGIFSFFDQQNSIINEHKTSPTLAAQITPEDWVVDDKVAFLDAIKNRTNNLVLMDRPGETHSQPQAEWLGRRIHSLTELVDLVQ